MGHLESQSSAVERAWLEAARKGDVDQMKKLRSLHPKWLHLDRKVDNTSSRFCSWDGYHLGTIGASALHTATWQGDNDLVMYLLEEGQGPDTQNDTGMTPIMLALMHHNLQATRCVFRDRVAIQRNLVMDCRQEDNERVQSTIDRIKLFLRADADVNTRCNDGKTALHYATTDETYEVAKLLIENGADVDVKDLDGKSPLHHSLHSSSLLVANVLLYHGVQLYSPDNEGETPLQLVIRNSDINMLQLMLNHHELVSVEGEDFAGFALMAAIDEGASDTIEFLLGEYVGLNHQNRQGETAMHRALLKRNADVTEVIRSMDAGWVELRTTTEETCLHYAARYSSVEELERLLAFYQHQRLLNYVNSTGETALHLAATASKDDRELKTRLLSNAGGRLLSCRPFIMTPSAAALSTQVQSLMRLWLAEMSLDVVTKFSLEYLGFISLDNSVTHPVLVTLLSSGYAVDVLPLWLALPFDRRSSMRLLEHIGTFGRQQNHSFILMLYEELAEGLNYS